MKLEFHLFKNVCYVQNFKSITHHITILCKCKTLLSQWPSFRFYEIRIPIHSTHSLEYLLRLQCVRLNITLKNNTIRCEKLATIVSGRKNIARPFVRRKQVSTNAEI